MSRDQRQREITLDDYYGIAHYNAVEIATASTNRFLQGEAWLEAYSRAYEAAVQAEYEKLGEPPRHRSLHPQRVRL